LVEDEFVSKIDELEDPLPDLQLRIVNDAYGNEASSDWVRLSGLVSSREDVEPDVEVSSDDLAIIPYTSGTTALPKAVAIPHRNYIVSMIPSYTTGIGLIEDDVWFYTMPFHTIAGMGMQIALLSLCNTIVYPFKTDPASALKAF